MPDISLKTLSAISNTSQKTMIQNKPDACGAFATIAAVGAHGILPMTAALSYANNGPEIVNNKVDTTDKDNYATLATSVYAVTGILAKSAGVFPVKPELTAAGGKYNSLAAMAQIAVDFGLNKPKIYAQKAGFTTLSKFYPGEKARCEAVVDKGNVDVDAGAYSKPGGNSTHLVCVMVGGGGLHWLAQGSNGNFYDPGDGSVNNAWAPTNTGDKMGGKYDFSGLWMVITK